MELGIPKLDKLLTLSVTEKVGIVLGELIQQLDLFLWPLACISELDLVATERSMYLNIDATIALWVEETTNLILYKSFEVQTVPQAVLEI